jgi:hypothetical protein
MVSVPAPNPAAGINRMAIRKAMYFNRQSSMAGSIADE